MLFLAAGNAGWRPRIGVVPTAASAEIVRGQAGAGIRAAGVHQGDV